MNDCSGRRGRSSEDRLGRRYEWKGFPPRLLGVLRLFLLENQETELVPKLSSGGSNICESSVRLLGEPVSPVYFVYLQGQTLAV